MKCPREGLIGECTDAGSPMAPQERQTVKLRLCNTLFAKAALDRSRHNSKQNLEAVPPDREAACNPCRPLPPSRFQHRQQCDPSPPNHQSEIQRNATTGSRSSHAMGAERHQMPSGRHAKRHARLDDGEQNERRTTSRREKREMANRRSGMVIVLRPGGGGSTQSAAWSAALAEITPTGRHRGNIGRNTASKGSASGHICRSSGCMRPNRLELGRECPRAFRQVSERGLAQGRTSSRRRAAKSRQATRGQAPVPSLLAARFVSARERARSPRARAKLELGHGPIVAKLGATLWIKSPQVGRTRANPWPSLGAMPNVAKNVTSLATMDLQRSTAPESIHTAQDVLETNPTQPESASAHMSRHGVPARASFG